MADEEVIKKLVSEAEAASVAKLGIVSSQFVVRWLAEVAASLIDGVSAGYIRALPASEEVLKPKPKTDPL